MNQLLRIGAALGALVLSCGAGSSAGESPGTDAGGTSFDVAVGETVGRGPTDAAAENAGQQDENGPQRDESGLQLGDAFDSASGTTDGTFTDAQEGGGAIDVAGGAPLPPALKWKQEYSATSILGIWGSGPTDIYGVGDNGVIVHSAGDGAWTPQDSGTGANLFGIWGSGPNDVYIAPDINAILHFTGAGGWQHEVVTPGFTFQGIWGSGPNDIYVFPTNLRSTGNGIWSPSAVPCNEPILAMWGSSATDIYAGGDFADMFHFTGSGWKPRPLGNNPLWSISGSGPNDVYVTNADQILHSTGNDVWTAQSVPVQLGVEGIRVVWALSKTAVFAGSISLKSTGVVFRSGGDGTWARQVVDPAQQAMTILAIWGTSPTNIYIAANGIYHGTP